MRPFCQITLICSRTGTSGNCVPLADLAKHLRESRLRRGWNQIICARYLGVCHKTLKNWEAGRMKPAKKFVPLIREFILLLPT